MQQSKAVEMLSGIHWNTTEEVWADLGCGSGTFTLALAHHLSPYSRIIAIEKDHRALQQIPDRYGLVTIEKKIADFENDDFSPVTLDGILMANSLHFVQNQKSFIKRTKQLLKPDGTFLIVEYDMDSSNSWVPYPVSYDRLKKLFTDCGFPSIQKLTEKPSRYNRSNLYSAIISIH